MNIETNFDAMIDEADLRRKEALEHAAAAFDAELLQQARNIAADVCAAANAASPHHDPENTAQYCRFMREGAYDTDKEVKIALAALIAGAA